MVLTTDYRKDVFLTARTTSDGYDTFRHPIAFYRWHVLYDPRTRHVGVIVSVSGIDAWGWTEVDRVLFPADVGPIDYTDDPAPLVILDASSATKAYRIARDIMHNHRFADTETER